MSTKSKLIETLSKSKAHRAAFVASQINIGIPFQVRALRKQKGWDQKKLAAEAGMAQPRISLIEKPGYGSLTLDTLKSLAAGFDVGLVVRFVPFGELMRWSNNFSPDTFVVPSFDDEINEASNSNENVVAFSFMTTQVTAKPTGEVKRNVYPLTAAQQSGSTILQVVGGN